MTKLATEIAAPANPWDPGSLKQTIDAGMKK
jgi:hypothetical protein